MRTAAAYRKVTRVPQPALPGEPPAEEGFEPSKTWAGARPGKVFKRGEHGLGYYADKATAAPAAAAAAAPKASSALDLDELDCDTISTDAVTLTRA